MTTNAGDDGRDRAVGGVRERARTEIVERALASAHRQLAEVGAAALSVRAVARDLGMASSAIYRYFPSRDALLTCLITDAYVDLAEAARRAEQAVDRADHQERFRETARATRRWAIADPHRYALLYGSPVPGYAAPVDTVEPAIAVGLLLLGAVDDAAASGATLRAMPVRAGLADEFTQLAQGLGASVAPGVLAAGITAWTALYGHLSFELFGHLTDVVTDRDAWFESFLDEQIARIWG
ncbi:TetR/AcrR family transcriptional regulator [Frigoribacterium sp. SL97]|uniref:TetR/AcrR family transcriptional regulator n=1 Tax=Frigoribacterium sp. SL97 TaxID=2994664 RepID=UPI0022709EB5|nr:TetR/AcrR family transcriptional regulator [Frigoribacterium sp. SL97]WAC50711.1 TetR/AcrR family transcriptional regulator [Frigoribacterium sp. SL97]